VIRPAESARGRPSYTGPMTAERSEGLSPIPPAIKRLWSREDSDLGLEKIARQAGDLRKPQHSPRQDVLKARCAYGRLEENP
jgi:hypothetical protein